MTPAPNAPAPSAPGGTQPRPARPDALVGEQRWLAAWFAGTPVRVDADAGGGVRVQVPLRYAFDDATSEPRPPLRAVLDRLGQSLQRQPSARLSVDAPGPNAHGRALAVRLYLQSRGVAAYRVVAGSAAPAAGVSLRLGLAPSAIERL